MSANFEILFVHELLVFSSGTQFLTTNL